MLTPERLRLAGSQLAPPRRAPAQRLSPAKDRLIVAGLVLLALGLRVPTISRYYWIDESISIGIASHPLGQIPALLRLDGSPPLWYVLLHFWLLAFGSTPVSTHVMALLFSLAVVPLAYWSGQQLFGRNAGLCAAALAATNPYLNWYATENRMYTLVVALSLVALTLTVKAVRDRRALDAAGAVVAFAALDYTHNWGLYLTTVTGLVLLWLVWRERDLRLGAWVLGCGAAVFLAYLPWLPSFLEQAAVTAAPWAVAPGLGDLFADPSTAIAGTAGAVVVPALVAAVWWTRRRRLRTPNPTAAFLAAAAIGTTLIGWVAAQIEPSWTIRYLGVTVAPWLLAAAGTLAVCRFGRRVVYGACAVLAAWAVVGALLPNPHPLDAKDNAAAVSAAASSYLQAGDLVVVTQTEQVPVLAHYLPAGLHYLNPMGPVSDPYVVDWKHIVSRLQQARACSAILPSIRRLPVGRSILEINPLYAVGSAGSAWYEAAHHQVVSDDALLAKDPALHMQRSFVQAISPKPYSPVIGVLFKKVSNAVPAACG